MPQLSEATRTLAATAVEQILLLSPPGFQSFEAKLLVEKGATRLDGHDVKLGTDGKVPPQGLFFDPMKRVDWLLDALTQLQKELGQPLTKWKVSFAPRSDVLVQSGVMIPIDSAKLVTGHALHAFLTLHGAKRVAAQEALKPQLTAWGPCQGWGRAEHRLHFGAKTVKAELIGAFDTAESTWGWSWANTSFEAELGQAMALAREGAPTTLELMKRPAFSCDEAFAFTVALVGAHFLGGRPVFKYPLDGTSTLLFFALDVV